MKKYYVVILIIAGFLTTGALNAQTYEFSYDPSGNRIKREYSVNVIPFRMADSSIQSEKSIKVFPNPFDNNITVSIEGDLEEIVVSRIQLFTIDGKFLFDKRINSNRQEIPTNGIAKGKYILLITRGDETSEYILIKN